MAEDWSSNSFWDFSLALYRRPGVADACLTLQERLGIDVNLLLYFAWRANQGQALSREEAAAIAAHVSAWHDGVVRPLRALRTDLKADAKSAPPAAVDRLRAQIKSAELNAERVEQDMLFALPHGGGAAHKKITGRRNIERYFEALKITAQPADWEAVDIILANTNL
jgi:uncharacterized protein (TIGR02444 family)